MAGGQLFFKRRTLTLGLVATALIASVSDVCAVATAPAGRDAAQ